MEFVSSEGKIRGRPVFVNETFARVVLELATTEKLKGELASVRGGGRCRNSNDRDAVDAAQVSPASEPERRLLRPDDDNYDAGDEEAGGAAKALEKAKNNTNGAVVSFTRALSRMRPDRGDAGIFDELHVEAYGHLVPLVQWLWWHARAEQVTV
ncbi:hypothetical protein PF005_g20544 [Phytophthora fragariae]|uniref:Uncharacterized protein n=1 Tax=Phytophthora fragariae TaxID=53985 RepID=A0A6A3UXW0_9STRA|nr:hypothetical protein PF011_g16713 [Phytophthora fragariae]KAE9088617.1 hypothetical protein PF007_g19903 [Phytophthora fragariae]KAE9151745.1 hypothetical protein PF006_g3993 [Phytophthora fragariae]KAE9187222.1 hypothetical protein PF005_g20544 [Phytophthora fragariae]KAE9198178.1 hypothetical protein PF004_g19624 [Phytophthora fragariae]